MLLINDVAQNGLPLEDADDLADLLNHLQSEQAYVSSHYGFRGRRDFRSGRRPLVWRRINVYRRELPRVFELRDLVQYSSSRDAYFQNFEKSLSEIPEKLKQFPRHRAGLPMSTKALAMP
ncbi:hypothetical protein RX330_10290 [Bradyrhizobium sp. NDS-1]|uniref:hypothetical protein n=1 Tax=Bradyrhizobium sp. NDS-1 TaxID=3080014 RepID=UPI00293E26CC|nr:hypothetical protein [Bradyrhizobium sp. NDS-1]WOH75462.1 hypothetical protein RX330_10290 [Bradyrhizobium sp. NDS-1]